MGNGSTIQLLENIEKVFAYNLRKLRGDRTQAKMAEILGIPQRTYEYMEEGHIPQKPRLARLSKVHKCPETALFLDPDLLPQVQVREPTKEEILAKIAAGLDALESPGIPVKPENPQIPEDITHALAALPPNHPRLQAVRAALGLEPPPPQGPSSQPTRPGAKVKK